MLDVLLDVQQKALHVSSIDEAKRLIRIIAIDGIAKHLRVLGTKISTRSRGLWMNFGHGHQGLTLGLVTGRLPAEPLTGESPAVDAAPYRPERW